MATYETAVKSILESKLKMEAMYGAPMQFAAARRDTILEYIGFSCRMSEVGIRAFKNGYPPDNESLSESLKKDTGLIFDIREDILDGKILMTQTRLPTTGYKPLVEDKYFTFDKTARG